MKPFESTAAEDGNVTPSSSDDDSEAVLPTVEQFQCSPCYRPRRSESPARLTTSDQQLIEVLRRDLLKARYALKTLEPRYSQELARHKSTISACRSDIRCIRGIAEQSHLVFLDFCKDLLALRD